MINQTRSFEPNNRVCRRLEVNRYLLSSGHRDAASLGLAAAKVNVTTSAV